MADLERAVHKHRDAEQVAADRAARIARLEDEVAAATRRAGESQEAAQAARTASDAAAAAAATKLANVQAELDGRIAGMQRQLADAAAHAAALQDELQQHQDEAAALTRDLAGAQAAGTKLTAQLAAAEARAAALADDVRREQHARSDEQDAAAAAAEGARQKAVSDLGVKDAIIAAIRIEKAQLEGRLSGDKAQLMRDVAALQADGAQLAADADVLRSELRREREEHAELRRKKEQLDLERFNLISVAIKCQEAQLKVGCRLLLLLLLL